MGWAKAILFLRNLKTIVLRIATAFLAIFAIAFAVWKGLPWLLPDDWRVKYAIEYLVSEDQVTVERRTHDCEWDSAPLGNKHCHYEAIVQAYNSDNKIVEGTGIETGAGGTTISYDGGKTWQNHPAPDNPSPVKVSVWWHRVED